MTQIQHTRKRAHVRACLEGMEQGRSIRTYVEAHGFSRSAMSSWLKEFDQEMPAMDSTSETKVSLVMVNRSQRYLSKQTSSLKVHINTLCVELPAGNSDADLRRVLLTLKEVL